MMMRIRPLSCRREVPGTVLGSRCRLALQRGNRCTDGLSNPNRTFCAPKLIENSASNEPPRRFEAAILREIKASLKLAFSGIAIVSVVGLTGGYLFEYSKQFTKVVPPGTIVSIPTAANDEMSSNSVNNVHIQLRGPSDSKVLVILDGGIGETSFDWDKVMNEVANFALVLAIDRPGLGFSKAGKEPRCAIQIADEYEAILQQIDVPEHVILVGHGAGGYNMRELASRMENKSTAIQSECDGLVLVDALEENLRSDLENVSKEVKLALQTLDINVARAVTLSKFGFIRLIYSIQREKNKLKFSPRALEYINHYAPSPAHRQGVVQENAALSLTEQHFRDMFTQNNPKASFPCVILSHGRPDVFESLPRIDPGIATPTLEELEKKWSLAQKRLAQKYPITVQSELKDAGHYILHEKPDTVAQVIRALIDDYIEKSGNMDQLVAVLPNCYCPNTVGTN